MLGIIKNVSQICGPLALGAKFEPSFFQLDDSEMILSPKVSRKMPGDLPLR